MSTGAAGARARRVDHVESYYAASAKASPERAALTSSIDCDICVVGGGIAGCSAALHLAERGYAVVLLEGERIGWGASGRSGAQAIFGVASGQEKLERLIGADDARKVWDATIDGLALLKSLIARHAIDCDWTPGQMQVAIKSRQDLEIRREVDALQATYGYAGIRYVAREELRGVLATERYVGASYDVNSGHLHPLNYTLGLAAAAERQGARIFESTRALSYSTVSGAAGAERVVRVRAAGCEVRAAHLVLAGNVYLGALAEQLRRKIMAVGTSIVATEPLGEPRAASLIANNAAVTDMNWVLDYFRRSADHRLLFGGRVSYSGLNPLGSERATRARMVAVFPQLGAARIDFAWGGYVDITLNRAPHFGRLESTVYFVQGFSGHGIVLAGMAGKLLAEAVAGTAERFDVFARIPHRDFPGGMALRRPALVLAMLYFRLRDLL